MQGPPLLGALAGFVVPCFWLVFYVLCWWLPAARGLEAAIDGRLFAIGEQPGVFVHPHWLKKQIGKVTILDTREEDSPTETIETAHRVSWKQFAVGPQSSNLRPVEDLRRELEALGVSSAPVVVAGAWKEGWGEEGRVYWMLKYLGHPESYILYGGIAQYEETGGGRLMSSVLVSGSFWKPSIPAIRATRASLNRSLETTLVLDSRDQEEYDSKVVTESLHGVQRPGHVTGAASYPWKNVFQGEDLKRCSTLRGVWEQLGDLSRPIVIYCTGGIRSGFLWAVMLHCGVENAANYDGSMWEWALDPSLPMTVGAQRGVLPALETELSVAQIAEQRRMIGHDWPCTAALCTRKLRPMRWSVRNNAFSRSLD